MAKLPKKPKTPKAKSSLTVWANYDARMKAWEQKVKAVKAAPAKKAAIKNKWANKSAATIK